MNLFSLREICENCGESYGSHRRIDDQCPRSEKSNDYRKGIEMVFKPISSTPTPEGTTKEDG